MSLRATYQLFLLVLGVLFESVREAQGTDCYALIYFEEIYLRSFIYYCMEHFIIISLVIMIWQNSQKVEDIKTDRFFVILCVLDLVDYLVTGNNVWEFIPLTHSKDSWYFILPLSMNVLTVACFLIYSNWQWRMNGSQSWRQR